jgi:hypothetical protein
MPNWTSFGKKTAIQFLLLTNEQVIHSACPKKAYARTINEALGTRSVEEFCCWMSNCGDEDEEKKMFAGDWNPRGGGGFIVLPSAALGSDSSPVLSPSLSDNTQCSAFNAQQRNKQVLGSWLLFSCPIQCTGVSKLRSMNARYKFTFPRAQSDRGPNSIYL